MEKNEQRTVLIGDIHGCLAELKALLSIIGWSKEAEDLRVILLGDLVDRGPDSVGVVRFARENGIERIRGNHDDRYVKYHENQEWHKNNPNNQKPSWLKNYPDRRKILDGLSKEDLEWIATAPTSIILEDHRTIAVHAGFLPRVPLAEQTDNTKMHVRFLWDNNAAAHLEKHNDYNPPGGSIFWAENYQEDWHVVYGHHVWDFSDIKIHTNKLGYKCYGIDTGCCFGGKLTGFELSKDGNHKIHQVDCIKTPVTPPSKPKRTRHASRVQNR